MLTGKRLSRQTASAILVATGILASICSPAISSENVPLPSDAFNDAKAAYDAAWDANGLAFAVATFTRDGGTAYGQYTPRSDSVFQDDDVLSIYAEPVGYSFTQSDGLYAFELTASYRLLNASGQVLAEQDDFAVFSGQGRSKQRELAAALSFQFSGLPAGAYTLETRFTNESDGETAGFSLPFSIADPN
ncbi:hypothetical protein [uncultured Roseibium sp.]|uniref:hypothetical protein n=1 Tax=uncultured Roseibium sp. TaxID=1936171 RepID=UPI00260AB25D|nr:hypothetical protein [uncultured Roseibium sp.]